LKVNISPNFWGFYLEFGTNFFFTFFFFLFSIVEKSKESEKMIQPPQQYLIV